MTRLPAHYDPLSAPEKATAQTTPSRSTIVAHIFKLNPVESAATALSNADLSCSELGNLCNHLRFFKRSYGCRLTPHVHLMLKEVLY